jgi:hypothetical protein
VDAAVESATTPVALDAPDAEASAQSTADDEPDEPTRVVSYRSIESGELAARQAAAAAAAAAQAGPAAEPAAAQTMPGMNDVMWDDEELSTHLYDGPSMAALDQPAETVGGAPASVRPGVAPFPSRPSVAPFSSRPSAAPFSSRPPPGSVPPAPTLAAPATVTTHRPPAGATPAWLLPALIAAASVVAFIALSMFQGSTPGTINLTTQPPDARVKFDGRDAESTLSPFVIGSVEPGVRHSIEVSREC